MELLKRLWTNKAISEDLKTPEALFQILKTRSQKTKKPETPVVAKIRSRLESDPEQACEENDSGPI